MHTHILLSHFGALRVTGEDALKYLQGQLTTDVSELDENGVQISSQCDNKGKAWSVFYLLKQQKDYFLIGEKTSLLITLRELKKYGVFSKVEFTDISSMATIIGEFDETTSNSIELSFTDANWGRLETTENAISFKPDTSHSRRIWFYPNGADKTNTKQSADAIALWKSLDVRAGLAQLHETTSGEFVPQMMNLQALGAISFNKGCYMGQETIARTKYLGKNKRAGFVLYSQGQSQLSPGETLEVKLGDSWRRSGTLLYSGHDEKQTWGFAVLPKDTEADAEFRLKDHPEVTWQLSSIPYSIND